MFILKAMADPHSKGGGTLTDGMGHNRGVGDFRVVQSNLRAGRSINQSVGLARASQTRANNARARARQAREAQRG